MQIKMKLNGTGHGGRRFGAGRKRIKSKGVAHRKREKVNEQTPLHINFKYRTHVRNKDTLRLLKRAIENARKQGLKILHFSFQSNHVHLMVEAKNNDVLSRGMRSLTITMAKGLYKGRIQLERYHLHVLRNARETKNALMYVLFNQQRHEKGTYSKINEYSSVLCFEHGLKLIRKFAQKHRIALGVGKSDWRPDPPMSWPMIRAVKVLIT